MSKRETSSASPPTVLLVSELENARRAEAARRKVRTSQRDFPWLWIAGGVGAAWVALSVVMVVFSGGQERTRLEPPRVGGPIALAAPAPRPGQKGAVPDIAEPFVVANQIEEAPPAPAAKIEIAALAVKNQKGQPQNPRGPIDEGMFAQKGLDNNGFADCGQIGTNVRFMRNPPAAFQNARAEKKMVFMVHLAGNLEDKEFT